ncbi:hypothetical protein B0H10DRAFT_1938505 [Mycena sp. CBHHK59/15]|nr:hypothetical protein B0H10DRAFT_1938505 [Mycena sp. CBHHK59/15]
MPARRHRLSLLTNHGGAGYSIPVGIQCSGRRQSQFNFGIPTFVAALHHLKISSTAERTTGSGATGLNFWPSRRGEYSADAPAPKSNQNPKGCCFSHSWNICRSSTAQKKRSFVERGAGVRNLRRAVFRQPTSVPPYSEIEAERERTLALSRGRGYGSISGKRW